jgi:hypothetical protein
MDGSQQRGQEIEAGGDMRPESRKYIEPMHALLLAKVGVEASADYQV